VATVNGSGQFITAWSDQRYDGGDIYLQNINPDGSLGSYAPWAAHDPNMSLPVRFVLHPAYPNPFNPQTTIAFDLPAPAMVTLAIYDLNGRQVATLLREEKPMGHYTVPFDATGFPSGVYVARMRAVSFTDSRKLLLLR
jgi:hypothetical protein